MLASVSERATQQYGFAYDERSGMYYDNRTGMYYDQVDKCFLPLSVLSPPFLFCSFPISLPSSLLFPPPPFSLKVYHLFPVNQIAIYNLNVLAILNEPELFCKLALCICQECGFHC